MFDSTLYNKIIADWIIKKNIQKGIDTVYKNSQVINQEVLRLLSIYFCSGIKTSDAI